MTDEDRCLIEVVIACACGQIGRIAAVEIIEDLDAAGFEIVRKRVDEQRTPEQDAALQELVDQAQELDMGYGQSPA